MPTIESFLLQGPAGRIECFVKHPSMAPGESPAAVAIVCHPHPLFGGSMHNKVVHAAAGALVDAGLPTLRFNFRGVGLSDGRHDGGAGEREDLGVVLDHVAATFPGLPILMAGYSFGAVVGLAAGCQDPRVAALIAIGLPLSLYDLSFLRLCDRPLAIVQGEEDQFGPLPIAMALASVLPAGARVLPVPGARHNFEGALDMLARRVKEAIPAEILSPGGVPSPGGAGSREQVPG